MLRAFWQKLFKFNWVFGLALVLLLGIPRFIIVLNANVADNYSKIAFIFLVMWFTPLIFLTKEGRRSIGIKKPVNYHWLFYAFIAGITLCTIVYFVGIGLFGHTFNNWFVYIAKSYNTKNILFNYQQRLAYFLIYACTAMTFSPIGEELFYRGIVHGSFAVRLGEKWASVADGAAFALTHLAHFGIVYIFGGWQFLFLPAMLWVLFMFLSSLLFFYCKVKTGSIAGAIICHAGFNLAMIYLIFYHILK
jgi:membrane protease YdiL (CAAX protease family)